MRDADRGALTLYPTPCDLRVTSARHALRTPFLVLVPCPDPALPFARYATQGPYITQIVCGGKKYTYDGDVLTPVTRRMALEGAVQVWNRKQLLEIMGDSQACPTWMALMGYERMTDAQINEVSFMFACSSCVSERARSCATQLSVQTLPFTKVAHIAACLARTCVPLPPLTQRHSRVDLVSPCA